MADNKGKTVHVNYKGIFDDGTVFDSSEGREPLTFEAGAGQVVPGFDKAVLEMKEGDKKTIKIAPEEAYGNARPELIQEVPKEMFADVKEKLEPGLVLGVHHPQVPQPIPAKVLEVNNDTVKMDMNHPLAGKTLNFEIELVKVE